MKKTAQAKSALSDFEKNIQKLGIHPTEVANGQIVRKPLMINSIAEYKDIFGSDINEGARKKHTENVKSTNPEAFNDKTERHLLTRLGVHVYGNHPLSKSDEQLATKYFPVKIQLEVAQNKTINTPITYGPSGSPQIFTYETLTFSGTGSITAENTILSLKTTNLVVGNLSGGKPYLINILGVTGAVGATGTAGKNQTGHAQDGNNATTPTPGICTGATSAGKGSPGAKGGNATSNGLTGNNGKPNLQTNITVSTTLTGILSVYTKSGEGGNGGVGGPGGLGQNGGKGGNGCSTGCECTDAADGGVGGNGGNGSNGGDGGNGVLGNDSFITVPSVSVNQIITGKDTAVAGLAGSAGAAGKPGDGGARGTTGTKHCHNGSSGKNGTGGVIGKGGTAGTVNGAPGTIHIN